MWLGSGKEPLTLDDCLRAFSESETLDEGNPWFCPKCQKSQCASKTLNICQAPPYLIVYLKRCVPRRVPWNRGHP